MAAFSFYQQPTFVFDSFLVPNASNQMPSMAEPAEGTTIIATEPYFAQMLANYECSHQEIPLHHRFHETKGPLHNTEMAVPIRYHEVTEMVTSDGEKMRKNVDIKKGKLGKERKYNGVMTKPHLKKQKKKVEASPSGYVRVRARREQATDSHSLAERVRRAKISVRMKLLQSIVPGCDKITGRALILNEIIKYVQSLQTLVEFLEAKLAYVTPMFIDSEVDFITNDPLAPEAIVH